MSELSDEERARALCSACHHITGRGVFGACCECIATALRATREPLAAEVARLTRDRDNYREYYDKMRAALNLPITANSEAGAAFVHYCMQKYLDEWNEARKQLATAQTEIDRLKTPLCIGWPTIIRLAREGAARFDSGHALVAADDLFRGSATKERP